MISHPNRHCAVELQALPSRIGQVRRIVSAHLRYWHMDTLIDRAVLGVTELLTNVHLHVRPDKSCTVELDLEPGRLTVSVRDRDPRLPVMDDPGPLATCGRGLAMVASVSESWGARPDGESGKVVWFSLTEDPVAPPATARDPRRPAEEVPAVVFTEAEPAPVPESAVEPGYAVEGAGTRTAPARSAVPG
ncbi:ATP-binding protein [Streptomyces sp. NPDC052077]|uniref:ATP-binding protein n=1 Tax=Streptomyces sp. NPDC052077 TaxID=3154757 RepID=UPI0034333CD9